MKRKGNLNPPSKIDSDKSTEIKNLRESYLKAKKDYNEAASKKRAEASFESLLNHVSDELKVDKNALDKAYNQNRDGLKKKFSSITHHENSAIDKLARYAPLCFIMSAMTSLMAANSEAYLELGFISSLFIAGGAVNVGLGIKELENKKLARNEIIAKSLEYKDNAQLPPPK